MRQAPGEGKKKPQVVKPRKVSTIDKAFSSGAKSRSETGKVLNIRDSYGDLIDFQRSPSGFGFKGKKPFEFPYTKIKTLVKKV